jgi:outer membrane scaffolding protein for murein synthesis (MipA/OmpV family)
VSVLKSSLRQTVFALALASATSSSLFGAGAASAADLPSKAPPPEPPVADWIVTISAMASTSPLYPGAKKYGFFGLPGVSIRRADQPERYSTPDDSFSIGLYDNDWLHVGPAGRYINERSVSSNHEIYGLPYVQPTVQLGVFGEVTPLSWMRIRLEVLQGVTGNDALVATLIGDVWRRWGPVTLSVGPRLYFGSDKYSEAYFSVTPAESVVNLANGGKLTPYNAVGGLTAVGGTGAARYDINETWRVTAFGNFQYLTGSDANSPVTIHAGSRDQYTVGLEIGYSFRTPGLFNF